MKITTFPQSHFILLNQSSWLLLDEAIDSGNTLLRESHVGVVFGHESKPEWQENLLKANYSAQTAHWNIFWGLVKQFFTLHNCAFKLPRILNTNVIETVVI
jgi:hypothetical protein